MKRTESNEELVRIVQNADDATAARAREALVKKNMGLVVKIATAHYSRHMTDDDLVQEGACGLLAAIEKYDFREGAKFTTCAAHWIRAYLTRAITAGLTTRAQRRSFFHVKRALKAMFAEGIEAPSDAQIAERIGVDEEDVIASMAVTSHRGSVQPSAWQNPDGTRSAYSWEDVHAEPSPDPEAQLIEEDEHRRRVFALHGALMLLDERERAIILRHHLAEERETLQEIAVSFGFTKARAHQLEARALEKMRAAMSIELDQVPETSRVYAPPLNTRKRGPLKAETKAKLREARLARAAERVVA